jgi:riboflavin kinase / FMN adenylyltransferase
MALIRNLIDLPPLPKGSVVGIGNFDGVHQAHRALLARVVACAAEKSAAPVAITFDPHPIRVLAPARAPKLLTTIEQRATLIEAMGIDRVVALPFNRELAHLSPADFVRQILVARLSAAMVVVGPNFRFGYRQAGDVATLRDLGQGGGFGVELLAPVRVRGELVSSTRIRELLSAGQVYRAGRLLGRPFSNSGGIVSGFGIGHRHAVPTLNLAAAQEQLPQNGVYVTRSWLGQAFYDSVTNLGRSPTFGERPVTLETYLLDFSGEIREGTMSVEYLHRLRDEIKFQNPALLKAQILEDARRATKYFRILRRLSRH